jgi:hypothetical protein
MIEPGKASLRAARVARRKICARMDSVPSASRPTIETRPAPVGGVVGRGLRRG